MVSYDKGYNPLRWDCEKQGCFNQVCRPKIEVFADCFPGRINFGDIDGIVEINGNGLILEWKSVPKDIPVGQDIMYSRFCKNNITTLVVVGNAQTMEVSHYGLYYNGKRYPVQGYKETDLETIKQKIRAWAGRAKPDHNHMK